MQCLDHTHFGAWSTARNNQRQHRKVVDLVITESIKCGSRHHNGTSHIAADTIHALWQDADLNGNRLGGFGVVTSKHMHRNTSFVALAHCRGRFRAWGVIETDQATESQVLLNKVAASVLANRDAGVNLAAGQGEHTQAKSCKHFHVADDFLAELVRHLDLSSLACRGVGIEVTSANTNDSLDGTLGEGKVLSGRVVLHNDTHALDIAIKGILGHFGPLGVVSGRKGNSIPAKAARKHLDGDLGGIAARVPSAILLVNGCQVGKGSHSEEILKTRLAVGEQIGWLGDLAVSGAGFGFLLSLGLEADLVRHPGVEANVSLGRVEGLRAGLHCVCTQTRDPSSTSNHFALCERSSLVAANIRHSTQRLKTLEVADNNVALDHALRTSSHGDGKNNDERCRDHGETRGDCVDNDLLARVELVRAQNDNSTDDSNAKKKHSKLAKLALKRGADIDAKEPANDIAKCQSIGFEVTVGSSFAVGLSLHGADAGIFFVESRGNGADLGAGSRGEDNALGAALGAGRAAVGHVQPVAGAGAVVEHAVLGLADGERFTRQQSFVGLEVLGLN